LDASRHHPSSKAPPDLLWKHVREVFDRMQADAPDGFMARVQVVLFDGEAFEPGHVVERESSAWIMFEVDDEGDVLTERRRVISVRPESIARVDVRFVRSDKRIGFKVDQPSPEGAGDSA
jgi:hypothetical protein